MMSRFRKNRWKLQSFWVSLIVFLSLPSVGLPADAPAPGVQGAAPGSPEAQAAKGLALDEVVRIALENHSSVKNAQFQINAQDAVVHQQMAAYYPTISFNNSYRTSNSSGTSPA